MVAEPGTFRGRSYRVVPRWSGPGHGNRGRIGLHAGTRDPDSAAARRDPLSQAALDAIPHGDPLRRGAIVATAELVDCVPIRHRADEATAGKTGET